MLSTSAIDCISPVRLGFVASVSQGWRIRGLTSVLRRETDGFDGIFSKWTVLWGDLFHRIKAIVVVRISQVKALSTPPYDDGVSEAEMVAVYKAKYAEMYP